MSLGREFHQASAKAEKALALVEDRQTSLGPGITRSPVPLSVKPIREHTGRCGHLVCKSHKWLLTIGHSKEC